MTLSPKGNTHVAFPSRRKTQERVSCSVAATTFTDRGFRFSFRSTWVGVVLAKRLRFTSTDARTFRCPFDSWREDVNSHDFHLGQLTPSPRIFTNSPFPLAPYSSHNA